MAPAHKPRLAVIYKVPDDSCTIYIIRQLQYLILVGDCHSYPIKTYFISYFRIKTLQNLISPFKSDNIAYLQKLKLPFYLSLQNA